MISAIHFDGGRPADKVLAELSIMSHLKPISFYVADWGGDDFAVVYADERISSRQVIKFLVDDFSGTLKAEDINVRGVIR